MTTLLSCFSFASLTSRTALTRRVPLPKALLGRLLLPSTLSLPSKRNETLRISTTACSPSDDELQLPTPTTSSTDGRFHPSIWGDYFISYPSPHLKPDSSHEERIQVLKKKVKSLFSLASSYLFQTLDLIDKIQRLGVAYHFESEIEETLLRIHLNDGAHFFDPKADDCAALNTTALRFRLLRQAGLYVSADVFNKFKDETGDFRSNLASDVHCLLSLYQASYLSFNEEDIMDEALAFTTKHLNSMVAAGLSPPIAAEVKRALDLPLRKRIERVEAASYIHAYQAHEFRNETLLELAKLDFNELQALHQKEIGEVSRWWKDVNIKSKLPFETKDRLVEGYAVIMSLYFEPQYSFGRILLSKMYGMLTVLDDAFDVYGDLKKLRPLTEAFQRWDARNVNDFNDNIKVIFEETLNVINEGKADLTTRGKPNGLLGMAYLKKEMQDYTNGLLKEAEIMYSEDLPTFDKWIPISTVTIAVKLLVVCAVLNLEEEIVTKHMFDWIASTPKIIQCSYFICRILDDIATFEGEKDRGIFVSSISCYMNDYGVSEPKAIENLLKMVDISWKDMNRECLRPNCVHMRVMNIIFNWTRVLDLYYPKGEDGYTDTKGHTKDIIVSLLTNPMSI